MQQSRTSSSVPFSVAVTQPSFLVFFNHKGCFFRGVQQRSVLGPVLFSFFINDLLASLASSVSCSNYTDDLAI